jgi:mRNA-degrading endonuclease RelE of RelBE toxin-antitoxin system
MGYQIIIQASARKNLRKIPAKDRIRLLTAATGLAGNPFADKKLEGEYAGSYSLRVWPYRLIYKVFRKEKVVLVSRFGQRGGFY